MAISCARLVALAAVSRACNVAHLPTAAAASICCCSCELKSPHGITEKIISPNVSPKPKHGLLPAGHRLQRPGRATGLGVVPFDGGHHRPARIALARVAYRNTYKTATAVMTTYMISRSTIRPAKSHPPKDVADLAQDIAGRTGACITITEDPAQAVVGADFIHTHVWVSMGMPKPSGLNESGSASRGRPWRPDAGHARSQAYPAELTP